MSLKLFSFEMGVAKRCDGAWNFQYRGILLIGIIVGQGSTVLSVGVDGGYFGIFSFFYHFFSFSLSLGDSLI